MILFRNWTQNFKYQFAKQEGQLQEMINATVSHEMRTPINAMLTQLRNLAFMLINNPQAQAMIRVVINSAELLLFLVNDMLDVYMMKNGRLQAIYNRCDFSVLMNEVMLMF
jgi:two-component system sensor histidine kinase EvgS